MIIIMKGMSKLANVPSGRTTISTKYINERTGEPTANFPTGDVSQLQGEIDSLNAAVGNSNSGLVKDVTDLQTTVEDINTWIGSTDILLTGYFVEFQFTMAQVQQLLALTSGQSASISDVPLVRDYPSFASMIKVYVPESFGAAFQGTVILDESVTTDAYTGFGYLAFQFLVGTTLTYFVFQVELTYVPPVEGDECTHNFKFTRI